MTKKNDFDLKDFMPYLLNQAAEVMSRDFEVIYRSRYGMLRTEWRVVFHLGRYGAMTAKDICDRARIHKTKVSRAVRALETKRFLRREQQVNDRRHESLSLTPTGQRVFEDLLKEARTYDKEVMSQFSDGDAAQIRKVLIQIAQL
ncbi:MarR family transcriptional regulator [uncultured Tateyamaria sp.]|uniref:MarR family winged helix-turn-helix transcriptional regulator n=1 Tax=uncultured Tateyamaria sp. TaxID=455651 RepID=UPI00262E1DCA|nr:MarR family transcriptional regulator [uncultured Tateyamaria sp.]